MRRRTCARPTPSGPGSTSSTAAGTRTTPTRSGAGCARHAPVYYDETADVWGISKHDDVLAIEKDPVTFSSLRAPRPHGMHLPMMISMDDPEHKARRGLVNRGFTPRRIAEMEPKVAELCRGIVDRISSVGSCDFVWDVAAPLPLMVIADLLGFDVAAHEDLLRWSDDLMRATTVDPTPAQAKAGFDAMMGFREFQLEVIARAPGGATRRPHLQVVPGRDRRGGPGRRVHRERGAAHPHRWRRDHPSRHQRRHGRPARASGCAGRTGGGSGLLPVAVEELLRWVSPVKNMARTATRDVELRGPAAAPRATS